MSPVAFPQEVNISRFNLDRKVSLYNPFQWKWLVLENSKVWSSAVGGYIPTDPVIPLPYTEIATEEELTDVLAVYGLPGPILRWPTLTNKQFWKVLARTGLHQTIMAFVDTLPLEDQIEAKQSDEYKPDHWLIAENRASFGLNDEEFKTIWFYGHTL